MVQHLQDMLQLLKTLLRLVLDYVRNLGLEHRLLVKRGPFQEPKVTVQIIHTVLDWRATEDPPVGRMQSPC